MSGPFYDSKYTCMETLPHFTRRHTDVNRLLKATNRGRDELAKNGIGSDFRLCKFEGITIKYFVWIFVIKIIIASIHTMRSTDATEASRNFKSYRESTATALSQMALKVDTQ